MTNAAPATIWFLSISTVVCLCLVVDLHWVVRDVKLENTKLKEDIAFLKRDIAKRFEETMGAKPEPRNQHSHDVLEKRIGSIETQITHLHANTIHSQDHRHLADTLEAVIAKTACISDSSNGNEFLIDRSCTANVHIYPCFDDRAAVDAALNDITTAEESYGPIKYWCFEEMTFNSLLLNKDTFNEDISGWDVSKVTSMKSMFDFCHSFDQDISGWDVSKVTSMAFMFYAATVFNQSISDWDVSQVTSMQSMFEETESFDQDLSSWNVSKVVEISGLFNTARSFNQDLCAWQSKLPTSCGVYGPFSGTACPVTGNPFLVNGYWGNICHSCSIPSDSPSLSPTESPTTSTSPSHQPTNSQSPSSHPSSLPSQSPSTHPSNQPSSQPTHSQSPSSHPSSLPSQSPSTHPSNQPSSAPSWTCLPDRTQVDTALADIPTAEEMYGPLKDWCFEAMSFNALFLGTEFNEDISGWGVSKVTDLSGMFLNANEFNQDISGWDVSSVENSYAMFALSNAFNQNLCAWKSVMPLGANVKSMFDSSPCAHEEPIQVNGEWEHLCGVCNPCANGILSGNVCCASSCGTCGGNGCHNLEGGASACCTGTIEESANSCDSWDEEACIVA